MEQICKYHGIPIRSDQADSIHRDATTAFAHVYRFSSDEVKKAEQMKKDGIRHGSYGEVEVVSKETIERELANMWLDLGYKEKRLVELIAALYDISEGDAKNQLQPFEEAMQFLFDKELEASDMALKEALSKK